MAAFWFERPLPIDLKLATDSALQVTGSSLFPAWFSKWVLDFAAERSAVIISPNYRLLPEVRGVDIIGDMREFWAWVQGGGPERYLETVGRSDVKLDLRQLLLVGESAGKSWIVVSLQQSN